MAKPNDVFQYSLLSAYNAGLKDGGPPASFVASQGTHGIGCFEEDEESDMVQIDGRIYTIDKDGDVEEADPDDTLPFAMSTNFQPKQRLKTPPNTTSKKLREVFEDAKNTPTAFKLTGQFKYINSRQKTFWDVKGTIFGFSVPAWQTTMSGEGLQCCFLSASREQGGTVVDFETAECVLESTRCGRFHITFPQDDEFDELRL